MRGVILVSLLFRIIDVFGQNVVEFTQVESKTDMVDGLKTNLNDLREKLNEVKIIKFGLLPHNLTDWVSEAPEKFQEKSGSQSFLQLTEDGRKLKYKKAELKFLMKLLIILKVVLGIILPLGIIASKILSWKAVTLSLMAFMFAKILFVKNILAGKNAFSVAPANFVSPLLFHGASNDAFWKRQGDAQNAYPWNST